MFAIQDLESLRQLPESKRHLGLAYPSISIYSPKLLGCQETKQIFFTHGCPWSAPELTYLTPNADACGGEWRMERWVVSRGLRLTDCFVWLTKQRRNIYAVA